MKKFCIGVTIALAAIASACGHKSEAEVTKHEPGASTAPPIVAVARAGPASLAKTVVLTAEFRPFQSIEVHAKVAGYVKQIMVDVGDRVKAGQTLAVLEVPEMSDDVARANAAHKRTEADVEHAKDELKRAQAAHQASHLIYQRLFDVSKQRPNLVAQQEIDDAKAKDLASEAGVSAARSALATRWPGRVTGTRNRTGGRKPGTGDGGGQYAAARLTLGLLAPVSFRAEAVRRRRGRSARNDPAIRDLPAARAPGSECQGRAVALGAGARSRSEYRHAARSRSALTFSPPPQQPEPAPRRRP